MMHLITGGSGSGKSAYAEAQILALNGERRIYIATMYPYDEESHRRIARHREMRAKKKFTTVECYRDLEKAEVPEGADVLLECMSNLTANEMFEPEGAGDRTVESVLAGVRSLAEKTAHLVVVTNDIFSDGMTYDEVTALYQERLGQINRELAGAFDQVTEVVCGIPIQLKVKGSSVI